MSEICGVNTVNRKFFRLSILLFITEHFLQIKNQCTVFFCKRFKHLTELVKSFVERKLFFNCINQKRHQIKNLCIRQLSLDPTVDLTHMRLHRSEKRRIILRPVVFPCIVYTDKHNNYIRLKVYTVFCKSVIKMVGSVACNTFDINMNILAVFSESLFKLKSIYVPAFNF